MTTQLQTAKQKLSSLKSSSVLISKADRDAIEKVTAVQVTGCLLVYLRM